VEHARALLLARRRRRLWAAGILAFVFVGVLLASFAFPAAAASQRTGDPLETAFQAFVGVTTVLTLNQLVLSQELGAVGDQRERMEGAMRFREDVGDTLGETPPAEPSAFLRVAVEETAHRAVAVREAASDPSDELERLLDSTEGSADGVLDRLVGATFGELDVVRAALGFNYSWKLYMVQRLLADEDCEEATADALADLSDALGLFDPAREQFNTLYFQFELIGLSRPVLYASIPSLVVTVLMLVFVDLSRYTGALLGVDTGVLLLAAAVAVAIAPFALLLAYVLRIAIVTGRTLPIGPFILRETDRETDR
jgi:hypothetical protein